MTPGTIADLARVHSEYMIEFWAQDGLKEDNDYEDSGKKCWYYEPLKPFELPIVSKNLHIDPERVEIWLMSLMNALSKIE